MESRMEDEGTRPTTRQSYSVPTHDIMSQFDEEGSEDDNEIELELTTEYMANGHSDMEAGEYAAAEENFRSALELAEEHDFADKLDYGAGDITLVLADCLARQEKEEEAMELLEPIADGVVGMHYSDVASVRAGSVTENSRELTTQLRACHNLGVIFLKRADVQAAEKRAQQAFKGRRKICGPHNPSTLDSVQLLIDIYTAKNDKTKARAYRRFLEPGTKSRLSSKISSAPPVLPPVFQPTATLTASAPTTLETTTPLGPVSSNHQEQPQSQSLPQVRHANNASATIRRQSSSNQPLASIDESKSFQPSHAPPDVHERPVLQLSESIRAAVQTASTFSTLPTSPQVSGTIRVQKPLTNGTSQVPIPFGTGLPTTDLFSHDSKEYLPASIELPPSPSASVARSEVSVPKASLAGARPKSPSNVSSTGSTVTLSFAPGQKSATTTTTSDTKTSVALPHIAKASQPVSHIVASAVMPPAIPTPAPTTETKRSPPSISDVQSTLSQSSTDTPIVRAPSPIRQPGPKTIMPSPPRKSLPAESPLFEKAQKSVSRPQAVSSALETRVAQPQHAKANGHPPPHLLKQPSRNTTNTVPSRNILPAMTFLPLDLADPTLTEIVPEATHPASADPEVTHADSSKSSNMSASQAAFASIFADSAGKLPRKKSQAVVAETISEECATNDRGGPFTSAIGENNSHISQPTAEISLSDEPSVFPEGSTSIEIPRQDQTTTPTSRALSWLADARLSVPASIARVVPASNTSVPRDSAPSMAQSLAAKRKAWSASLSKGRKVSLRNSQPSALSTTSSSIATNYTSSRNVSVTTLQSNAAEPKRHLSLIGSISSQPLSFLNKELSLAREKSPRPSMSLSCGSMTQMNPRSRQELAPKFASIKALRMDGKKSASLDAAIKLLREYDVDRNVLATRESELKKNLREGLLGLASTGYGFAPIHFFCDRKVESLIELELLIEQGVDVNAIAFKNDTSEQEPFTPLQQAIENGHTEIVRLLVDADVTISPPRQEKNNLTVGNAEPLTHPLLLACTKGHTEIIKILLNGGAARLLKEFPHREWHGNSLLHEACWHAHTTMVKMLLGQLKVVRSQYHSSAGPDFESGVIGAPGQQDRFGATPIMYAVDLRDCTDEHMRVQKTARRKDCLKLLLEHDIHGDLHSQEYRDNIARVLSTKWTRGPGKGHSIFCYCDEAADEELNHLIDPFRYQVPPSERCYATPQCSPTATTSGVSIRDESVKSGSTERQTRHPEFPELMSVPVTWPVNTNDNNGEHFELASNFSSTLPDFEHATPGTNGGIEEPMSPVTVTSNGYGHINGDGTGKRGGISELSDTST